MGYLNSEGDWCADEQDDRRRQFHSAAKDHFQALQERVDRPVDHAVGEDRDETRRASRQAFDSTRSASTPKT